MSRNFLDVMVVCFATRRAMELRGSRPSTASGFPGLNPPQA